jgi:hypothetical protein
MCYVSSRVQMSQLFIPRFLQILLLLSATGTVGTWCPKHLAAQTAQF